MKKLSLIIAMTVLAITILTGCGEDKSKETQSEEPKETVTVQEDTVKISLSDSSASTGYVWLYEVADTAVLEFVSDELIPSSIKKDEHGIPLVGAAGVHHYIFKGKNEGETTVTFTAKSPAGVIDENEKLVYAVTVDKNLNCKVKDK